MASHLSTFPYRKRTIPAWGQICLGVATALLIGLIPLAGTAKAQSCANESDVKSAPAGGATVLLSFRNASDQNRRIYWINQDGQRKFYGIVEPGHILQQPSYPGFAWEVTDESEKCLRIITATNEAITVNIGGPSAAQLAPPSGTEVPIAETPPSAPAPTPQQAAAPEPSPQQATAPAPTLQEATATAQLPQVSPIEQFRLHGSYRLIPPNDPHKALNFGPVGGIEIVNVSAESSSAKWMFEAVPGTPYVRIKNDWKHSYLADHNGELQLLNADISEQNTLWGFVPIDGTPYVQLQNFATGRYLLTVNGEPVLADDLPPGHESRSRWDVVSTHQPVMASEMNDAYAEAVASCHEIGGYWTGASCQAPGPEALECPRGWLWSPENGACIWAGHEHCPPWQWHEGRCFADLTCVGGRVHMTPYGLTCHCPRGTAVWGSYPHLRCMPSLAIIVPLLRTIVGEINFGGGKGNFGGKGGKKFKGKPGPVNANNGGFPKNNGGPKQQVGKGGSGRPSKGKVVKIGPNRPGKGKVVKVGQGKPGKVPPRGVKLPVNKNAAAEKSKEKAKAKAEQKKAAQKARQRTQQEARKAKAEQEKAAKQAQQRAQQEKAAKERAARQGQQRAQQQRAAQQRAQQQRAAQQRAQQQRAAQQRAQQQRAAQQRAQQQRAAQQRAQQCATSAHVWMFCGAHDMSASGRWC
jgi:hypothetical protein